jgi:gamma-glutamyltranspeptidase/glutathione hydrolase
VDAAIAAQIVLTLVSRNRIGGGGFLLYYDGKSRIWIYDGGRRRGAATAICSCKRRHAQGVLRRCRGRPLGGTPGACACWSRCIATRQAALGGCSMTRSAWPSRGFPVSPRLAASIAGDEYLKQSGAAAAYFYDARVSRCKPGPS